MHRLDEVIQTGLRTQAVLDRTQSWQRAETARNVALSYAYSGRFAELDSVLYEIERTANRVGHFGALWVASRARAAADLASSGNIEVFRRQTEADLQGPAQWRFVTQLPLGVATFYLGDVEAARTVLNAAAAEQPARSSWVGVAEANLLATWAFIGDSETAHRAYLRVSPMVARADSHNLAGRWLALMAAVPALRLIDDRAAAAALYPATLKLIETGQVHDMVTIGPNTPRLSAALAAEAGGLIEEARGHFEAALQTAERLSHRLLLPAVKSWLRPNARREGQRRRSSARVRIARPGGKGVPRPEDADPYRTRGTSARFAAVIKKLAVAARQSSTAQPCRLPATPRPPHARRDAPRRSPTR